MFEVLVYVNYLIYLVCSFQGESKSGGVSWSILTWPSCTLLSFVQGYFVPLGFVTWKGFNEAHLWYGHPTHTASWRCLKSRYMHLLIFFPSTTGLSHWVYRARFWCSNSNASRSHRHTICLWSRWDDFTYFRGFDVTASYSSALYSFLRPGLFLFPQSFYYLARF